MRVETQAQTLSLCSCRDSGGVAAGSEGGHRGLLHRPLWIPGLGLLSLVTVSYRGPDGAGGTTLAVLPHIWHQEMDSCLPGRWETSTAVSHLGKGSTAGEGLQFQHHLLLQIHFLP